MEEKIFLSENQTGIWHLKMHWEHTEKRILLRKYSNSLEKWN